MRNGQKREICGMRKRNHSPGLHTIQENIGIFTGFITFNEN
jgi:hypothetical protein